jgi:hypothetical protein
MILERFQAVIPCTFLLVLLLLRRFAGYDRTVLPAKECADSDGGEDQINDMS